MLTTRARARGWAFKGVRRSACQPRMWKHGARGAHAPLRHVRPRIPHHVPLAAARGGAPGPVAVCKVRLRTVVPRAFDGEADILEGRLDGADTEV